MRTGKVSTWVIFINDLPVPRPGPRRGACLLPRRLAAVLAPLQRHQRERRAVLLMIVVQRVVPPGAVCFLDRQQQVGQVVLIERALAGRQLADAPRRVVMAEVVEVA